MKQRVFLTGVNGYLGSLLAEKLGQMPEVESVTGLGLSTPKMRLPEKVNFLRMDMRSPNLAEAMAGHDVVVHTACVVLWPAKMSVKERDDNNVNGVRNVGEAALANKVERFIHASSMAAYDPTLARGQSNVVEDFTLGDGRSGYYYWNGKASAEKTLTSLFAGTGTVLTMLRPIYIIGPRNKAVVQSYRKNAVSFLGCNPRRQFVHEQDVVGAFAQALRSDMPGAFNVVPDDFIRLNDVWEIMGVKMVPRVPVWLARLFTWLKWRYLGSPIHSSWVSDMLVDFTGSNAKLKSTGWRPSCGSADALRSAL